ncbi:hypothetical protein SISSUDRAFT_562197 [Sistotremastrum suecicum HHB10207 ss-3]|uniref:Uncharacterized protein n=1 Tax=Sistotremastrum suecicum HHB10207 ss-3 TaxID=1314776 RepID=A0A166EST9_9AGAM|nr:hypothetical protein SISSUDRAFT_562197 [Sistotremastrum suecicum HHB10207 ss-3]
MGVIDYAVRAAFIERRNEGSTPTLSVHSKTIVTIALPIIVLFFLVLCCRCCGCCRCGRRTVVAQRRSGHEEFPTGLQNGPSILGPLSDLETSRSWNELSDIERIQLVRLLLPDHPIARPPPAVVAPRRGETLPAYDPSHLPVYKAAEEPASPTSPSAPSDETRPRGDAPPYAPARESIREEQVSYPPASRERRSPE